MTDSKDITLKRIRFLEMRKALEALSKSFGRPGFVYARNSKILDEAIQEMEAFKQRPPAYEEYEQKAQALIESHAKKDENGDPVRHIYDPVEDAYIPDAYGDLIVPEEGSGYNEKKEKLDEQYQEAISQMEEVLRQYREEFLEEETTIRMGSVSFNDIPQKVRQDPQLMSYLGQIVDPSTVNIDELTGKETRAVMEFAPEMIG